MNNRLRELETENEILRQKLYAERKSQEILKLRLELNDLSFTEPFENVVTAVVNSAEKLTSSRIGFFHFYNEQTETITLQTWSTNTLLHFCSAVPKTEQFNLSSAGIWSVCIRERRPVIHNDFTGVPQKGTPEGHTGIIREMTVPIIRDDMIVGILGVGNKLSDYNQDDQENLSKFADVAWETIVNKRLLLELEEKEDKHTALLDTMTEGVSLNELVFDEKGEISNFRILEINHSYTVLTGIKNVKVEDKLAIEGKLATDIYNIDVEFIKKYWADNYLNEEPVIIDYSQPDDRYTQVSISPIKNNRFTTVIRDITDIRKSENERRKNELRYKAIVETSQDGFWITDINGIIREINTRYTELSGYSREEVIGKRIYDFDSAKNPELFSTDILKLTQEKHAFFESLHRKKDGTQWPVEITTTYSEEDGGTLYVFIKDISGRKTREKEKEITKNLLIRNETRYRKISSLISNIAYSCRRKNDCLRFDWIAGSVQKTLGYTIDEMYEKGCWKSLVIKEDLHLFHKNIDELKPGEKTSFELRIKTKEGKIRWISSVAECNNNSDEAENLTIYGALIDITEEKKSDEALNHSYALMRYIIEHTRGAVAVHDRDLRYIYVSEKYISDFKIKEQDVIGRHHYDLFPKLPERFRVAHQEALNGNVVRKEDETYEWEDGTIDWGRWECRPWYEANSSIGGIIVYNEFITERKNIELALKASESQLDSIFNSAPVIMILLNERREILKINKFGIESTGANIEILHGLKPGDILKCINATSSPEGCGTSPFCEQCILRNTINSTLNTGCEFYKIETGLITAENGFEKQHTILLSTSMIASIPEKQILITIDDITLRKNLEKELIKARDKAEESDNLKTAFLANISHEIRTPMNGIMGFSEMLSNQNLSEQKRNQFCTLIQDGCRQLLDILNDVIEISMIESGQISAKMSEFNLNELMQEVLYIYRSAAYNKNITLNFKPDPRNLTILNDRDKLMHVLSNMISNALKFTDIGGIDIGYDHDDNVVKFFIRDTGIGIRKELHEVIFERFRQAETSDTRNYGGTGLGLSIAKGLIDFLGGRIWLESEPGFGTTFYFSLPTRLQRSTENKYAGSNKILIAENNSETNYQFIEVLQNLNCMPLYAKNGAEAVKLFKEHDSVRLILMDIRMPVMDGYQATSAIRKIDPEIPIIAQMTHTMHSDMKDLNRSVFNGIILKPMNIEKLESLVRQYLK